ncbi:hypothetical protein [uncultured Fibrobacter sp.]|uniref:hypothetical protein n=1 Tax=uncultured Fibrobacter sp. TaxID=261512 RepID=UPI0025EC400E|nr:hypothetical protein [uncultured Fibrobacter sp.]
MNFKIIATAAALLATQSFAIIGVGAHYAPGFGTKMKAGPKAKVADNIDFSHEGFDEMMQGFGFKLWIDLLPIIDIEGTFNIQFGSYDASLYVKNPTSGAENEIPLEIELGGTPFAKANPKYVAMNGDLSITYPITSLPIIRPYIGGGLTVFANSFVLNQAYVSSLVNDQAIADMIKAAAQGGATQEELQQQQEKLQNAGEALKKRVQEKAAKESINTSIGGHALVGFRLKLPIIPIAAYCNFKYYFGGDYPTEIDPGHMTLEVGGGLAI